METDTGTHLQPVHVEGHICLPEDVLMLYASTDRIQSPAWRQSKPLNQ